MKQYLIIFLTAVILLQSNMRLIIVTNYLLNKTYIVEALCENRDKPNMHCDGKCYLAKKIKAQEKQETKNPSLLKKIEDCILFCIPLHGEFTKVVYLYKNYIFYKIPSYTSPLSSIFHPPPEN